jgi:hypothetical protein
MPEPDTAHLMEQLHLDADAPEFVALLERLKATARPQGRDRPARDQKLLTGHAGNEECTANIDFHCIPRYDIYS